MATWTTLHIQTDQQEKVGAKIIELLGQEKAIEVTKGNSPNLYDHYTLSTSTLPNFLAIGKGQPDWVTVRYNNGNNLEEWGKLLSKVFQSVVIIVIAQSVADYYYLAVYNSGQKRREIEVCYSAESEMVNFGSKFAFEAEKPGIEFESVQGKSFIFDFDAIRKYTAALGLNLEFDYSAYQWTIISRQTNEKTVQQKTKELAKRVNSRGAWWKFW